MNSNDTLYNIVPVVIIYSNILRIDIKFSHPKCLWDIIFIIYQLAKFGQYTIYQVRHASYNFLPAYFFEKDLT